MKNEILVDEGIKKYSQIKMSHYENYGDQICFFNTFALIMSFVLYFIYLIKPHPIWMCAICSQIVIFIINLIAHKILMKKIEKYYNFSQSKKVGVTYLDRKNVLKQNNNIIYRNKQYNCISCVCKDISPCFILIKGNKVNFVIEVKGL